MQSPDFLRRMETVLAARVEEKKTREHGRARRLKQAGSVVAGTLACFFVLKAAALAHDSRVFTAPVAAEAGLGAGLYHWFAGADPVSTALAATLRPVAARLIGGTSTL